MRPTTLITLLAALAMAWPAWGQFRSPNRVSPFRTTMTLNSGTYSLGLCPSGSATLESSSGAVTISYSNTVDTAGTTIASLATNGAKAEWTGLSSEFIVVGVDTADTSGTLHVFCGDSLYGGKAPNVPGLAGTQGNTETLAALDTLQYFTDVPDIKRVIYADVDAGSGNGTGTATDPFGDLSDAVSAVTCGTMLVLDSADTWDDSGTLNAGPLDAGLYIAPDCSSNDETFLWIRSATHASATSAEWTFDGSRTTFDCSASTGPTTALIGLSSTTSGTLIVENVNATCDATTAVDVFSINTGRAYLLNVSCTQNSTAETDQCFTTHNGSQMVVNNGSCTSTGGPCIEGVDTSGVVFIGNDDLKLTTAGSNLGTLQLQDAMTLDVIGPHIWMDNTGTNTNAGIYAQATQWTTPTLRVSRAVITGDAGNTLGQTRALWLNSTGTEGPVTVELNQLTLSGNPAGAAEQASGLIFQDDGGANVDTSTISVNGLTAEDIDDPVIWVYQDYFTGATFTVRNWVVDADDSTHVSGYYYRVNPASGGNITSATWSAFQTAIAASINTAFLDNFDTPTDTATEGVAGTELTNTLYCSGTNDCDGAADAYVHALSVCVPSVYLGAKVCSFSLDGISAGR